jgi:hypothetical protein
LSGTRLGNLKRHIFRYHPDEWKILEKKEEPVKETLPGNFIL